MKMNTKYDGGANMGKEIAYICVRNSLYKVPIVGIMNKDHKYNYMPPQDLIYRCPEGYIIDFIFLDEIHICVLTSAFTACVVNRYTD
jgi:hypothetical protein